MLGEAMLTLPSHLKALQGVDRSPKGSFDAPILDMLNFLNDVMPIYASQLDNYVTTSSCSGRVSMFHQEQQATPAQKAAANHTNQDKGGRWLLCEHAEVQLDQVKRAVEEYLAVGKAAGLLSFRHEPFVLHAQCESMDDAQRLLKVALGCGFRESGIVLGASNRYMVGVRTSAMKLEVPLGLEGNLMVSWDYLGWLTDIANAKFRANKKRTDELYAALKNEFACARGRGGGVLSGDGDWCWSVIVPSKMAKKVKTEFESKGWFDKKRKISPHGEQTGMLAVPITADAYNEIGGDARSIVVDGLSADQVQIAEVALPRSNAVASPAAQLQAKGRAFLQKQGVVEAAEVSRLLNELPTKWEKIGDLALIPQDRLLDPIWQSDDGAFRAETANVLGVTRLARQQRVDPGPMRQSQAEMLHGTSGWVEQKENGVIYGLDVTKVMFSSGNGTEKRRVGNFDCSKQTVVDLYAGIGYFTLPYLVHANAAFLYACEMNPDSVYALKRNLERNRVTSKCEILEGDNQQTTLRIPGVADHVNLGLIPSSEDAWPLAVHVLKESGGTLHVHGNVIVKDSPNAEDDWCDYVLIVMKKLLEARDSTKGLQRKWSTTKDHLERVKWYAPHIRHVVLDVSCRPIA